MNKLSRILLIINHEKNIPPEFLSILEMILTDNECYVFAFADSHAYLESKNCSIKHGILTNNSALKDIDMAIVLGGDGSILRASTTLSAYDVPILGINFGTLGYMAELEAKDVQLLSDVLHGDYKIDERMMLSTVIEKADGSKVMMPPALNDIVLSNGPVARILNFTVSCNGVMIEKCRADGMVISTPTGSTAYSMSAGGPVMAPGLEVLCLTPICPHSFSSRPVILQGDSTVVISDIGAVRDNSVYITVDGRLAERIESGDSLVITRAETRTKLIRLKNNSFLSVLNSKLQEV